MGSSKQTSTSKAKPYGPAEGLVKQQADMSTNYLSNPDPMERAAAAQSRDYLSSVVGGDYLNAGNPHTQALFDSIKASVMPAVNANFANAGLSNSTLHQGMLAKALTQGYAQPLFAQYDAERARQMQAAGALPGAAMGASDIGLINQTLPVAQSFAPYASQTQTSQTKQPLANQIAGGALMGASILAAPYTGGASLAGLGAGSNMMGGGQTVGGALSNVAQGGPAMYSHSWAPWVTYGV